MLNLNRKSNKKKVLTFIKILYLAIINKNYIAFTKFKLNYQLVIKLFIYLILNTRPNIIYTILIISYYLFNPNNSY